jgi:hypothetical protein
MLTILKGIEVTQPLVMEKEVYLCPTMPNVFSFSFSLSLSLSLPPPSPSFLSLRIDKQLKKRG